MRRCLSSAGQVPIAQRAGTIAVALMTTLITLADNSRAEQIDDPNSQKYGWREVWGGADATKDVWLLYTGVTLAPLSKDIYSDGLRFRVNSGYGQYQYVGREATCDALAVFDCNTKIKVDVTYTDALIGYHMRLGELTAKAFAGASIISHDFGRHQTKKSVQGVDIGATAGLEFWLNLGKDGWTSLDLQYTTAHDTGSARWRAGWRVIPALSIGPEVRFDTNATQNAGRIGAFARYDWIGGEISVAGGLAQEVCRFDDVLCENDGGDDKEISPYVTINLLSQF